MNYCRTYEGNPDQRMEMKLANTGGPIIKFDGEYVYFLMQDGTTPVWCAVMYAYLIARDEKAGVIHRSHREAFHQYRDDVEKLASLQYDLGFGRPLITTVHS